MRVSLIVVAAGEGRRMRSSARVRKPFLTVHGRSVLEWTLRCFQGIPEIREILLVLNPKDMAWAPRNFGRMLGTWGVQKCVPGGRRRQDSVWNGLRHTDPRNDVVMIHDGVRPCVAKSVIRSVLKAAGRYGGAIAALPAVETIKVVDRAGRVRSTPDRSTLWSVQTPQAFRRRHLMAAYRRWRGRKGGGEATDDSRVVESAGFPVVVVPGNPENVKITRSMDLDLAHRLIRNAVKSL